MDEEHFRIWRAIDKIAYANGISVSALAKKAGLDSTAFNKTKRFYPCGKHRWVSLGTISKLLKVVDMDWIEFGKLIMEDSNIEK